MDQEEIEELADDSLELLHRAMEVLKKVRIEYCSADTYVEAKFLLAAFKYRNRRYQ